MYGSVALSDPPRVERPANISLRVTRSDNNLLSQDSPLGSPVGVETANELARKRSANAFIPVVCSIFGVIIFMRLGLIVGVVGLTRAWGIVIVAFTITFLSIGSLSALASSRSRGHRDDGGFYEAVLQAVGLHAGCVVGVLLFLAFSIASAYYLLGFAEITMFYLGINFKNHPLPWNESGSWVTVAIASSMLALLTGGFMAGGRIGKRTLVGVFVVVMVSIGCNVLFLIVHNSSTATGASKRFLRGNVSGHEPELVLKMFCEFFPAFCGVLAGANLADDLMVHSPSSQTQRKTSVNLIIGIHKALGFSCFVYCALSLVLAACVENGNLRKQQFVVQLVVDSILGIPLIYLGIAATTLTSALSNVMTAASLYTTIRSFRVDGIEGQLAQLKSGSCWGFMLAWALCQLMVVCGSVDTIIPIVSSTFLFTFAVVNFACFYHEIMSPSFDSAFTMYSKWSALLGFCLSIGSLFLVMSTFFVGCMILALMATLAFFQNAIPGLVENNRRRESKQTKRSERSSTYQQPFSSLIDSLTSSYSNSPVSRIDQNSDAQNLDDLSEQTKRIELAALYVRDALHGRFLGEEYVSEGLQKLEFKRWYHALQFARMGNMAVLLGLSFFELPSWCHFSLNCGDPQHVLMWDLPTLPKEATFVIELLNLGLLGFEAALKFKYLGKRLYFANKWYLAQMVLLLSGVISIVLIAIVPQHNVDNAEQQRLIILSPILRPLLLLTMSERLRSGFVSLLRVLPRVMDGLLTICVLIVIYSISGMVMFEGTEEGRQYFPDFQTSWMNMLVLLTTANFPDVMMPAYDRSRYSSIFFISFLMIGLLLMMNLVFASIYQNYRQEVSQRAVQYANRRQKSLEFAFQLLPGQFIKDGDHNPVKVITRDTLESLISELLRPVVSFFDTKREPAIKSENDIMRGGADTRVTEIKLAQFIAKVKGFAARQKSKAKRVPPVHRSQSSCRLVKIVVGFVKTRWFDYSVDVIIFGNLVAILFEIQARIDGDQAYMQWEMYMPLFSCLYLIEMALKLYAYRWRNYFMSFKNRYDCVVTVVIFVAEVSIQVHYTKGMNWQWIRILLLLRFLRCLRLLVALQSLSTMFSIVLELLPTFTTLYGMLGIVMMEYAAIGVQIFGGKLIIGDARLAQSSFGKANYFSNNFNDFASAMTTLFELLLVNNWNIIVDGTEIVTSKWSRIYFISFYVIANVMMLNLVVAFVVEAYFEQAAAQDDEGSSTSQFEKPPGSSTFTSPPGSSTALNTVGLSEVYDDDKIRQITRPKRPAVVMKPRADSVYIEDVL